MDQEVAKTLGELEIKLQELERELTSIGKHNAQPSKLQAPSKLVDEAVEDDEQERAVDNAFGGPAVFGGEEVPAQGTTIERDSAFPVSETAYGEIATDSPQTPTASFPSGVFSPATQGTPPPQPDPPLPPTGPPLPPPGGTPQSSTPMSFPSSTPGPFPPPAPPWPPSAPSTPAPQPPPLPQPIDRAELVRFKEKLQRTMEELVDEYGKLLLPKPPA